MFSSKQSKDLPYCAGQEVSIYDTTINGEAGSVVVRDYKQHNEPNPILLSFRRYVEHAGIAVALIEVHIDGVAFYRPASATQDHIEHARRVLERLARLTEVAS